MSCMSDMNGKAAESLKTGPKASRYSDFVPLAAFRSKGIEGE